MVTFIMGLPVGLLGMARLEARRGGEADFARAAIQRLPKGKRRTT